MIERCAHEASAGDGRRADIRQALRGWPAAALVFVAACATELPTTFHTLLPLERPAPVTQEPGPVVRVERVRVPDAVDQPQWLIRLEDGTLAQLERERWASPPSYEIAQALRERLRLAFNMPAEASAGSARAAWSVRVEVLRFETLPDEARLEAVWSLADEAPGRGVALRCTTYLRQPASSGGMAALGQAHRQAVAELGTAIGTQLLALHRGGAAACPA